MEKIMETLLNTDVQAVKLRDYSQYEEERSDNGGCYGFTKTLSRVENVEDTDGNPMFSVLYDTTADFPFDPFAGSFEDKEKWRKEQTVLSLRQAAKVINDFCAQIAPDNPDNGLSCEVIHYPEPVEPQNVTFGLCAGCNCHEIPNVSEYIFDYIPDKKVTDIFWMEDIAYGKLCYYVGGHLDLYVTGLKSALIAVLNECSDLEIDVTLWHYDTTAKKYFPQQVRK
jgi:hypothetical protein